MNWWTKLFGRKLASATNEYLRQLQVRPVHPAIAAGAGPGVLLGYAGNHPIRVPLEELIAFSLCDGSPGAGKTVFDCIIIEALLRRRRPFGVLDPKGELFERALYLCAKYDQLDRTVIIDFGNRTVISPYDILTPWGDDFDYFIHCRLETLKQLLPARDRLSLRAAGLLKHELVLLAGSRRPITDAVRVLQDAVLRTRLVRECRYPETKYYFQNLFPKENPSTIASLSGRIAALFSSESIRYALSAKGAPDFRRLQDDGYNILIRCSGRFISREVRVLLQDLGLSDVRQSTFTRENSRPFFWIMDEAQNFFRNRQQTDGVEELLRMGRSYGVFLHLITQHLGSGIDRDILDLLQGAIIRWSMTFRNSPQDCNFLKSALPVTGRLAKPRGHFAERQYYTEHEERTLLHEGIAKLPDRVGYLWLKTRYATAIRLRTKTVSFPNLRYVVDAILQDPDIGQRVAADTIKKPQNPESPRATLEEKMRKAYRK